MKYIKGLFVVVVLVGLYVNIAETLLVLAVLFGIYLVVRMI